MRSLALRETSTSSALVSHWITTFRRVASGGNGVVKCRRTRARVVVVCEDDEATLVDCLDALQRQRPADVEVVVVDRSSGDRSTDVAIGHPVVDVVRVVPRRAPVQAVLEAATEYSDAERLLVVSARLRPGPAWIEAGIQLLLDHDVVLDEAHGIDAMAVDYAPIRLIGALDVTGREAIAARVRAGGRRFCIADDHRFSTGSADRREPVIIGTLPPTPRPGERRPRFTGTITVVVCTRERDRQLRRCLESLAALEDDDHEVLVVDNNDRPTVSPAPIEARARVVHESRVGLDIARNRGLAEARSSVVAYVDDDCEVDPHWLSALRISLADPAVAMVAGRVRPASLRAPSERQFEVHFGFDRGTRPARFTSHDRRPWFPLWAGLFGTGCNMAFRVELLESIGGFDEILDMGTSIGGGGDLDAYVRLIDSGAVAAYAPDALVWHHHRSDPGELRRQFVGYGTSTGALLTKAMIDRPSVRLDAVRFWFLRLRLSIRALRHARRGQSVVPASLVLLDVYGHLRGPWRYLRARLGHRRA